MSTLAPKVKDMYDAVIKLITEDVDINTLTVSDITKKAGIGKGTAYEYFSSKDELIIKAVLWHIEKFTNTIIRQMDQYSNFEDKVNFLFVVVDKGEECKGSFQMMEMMEAPSSLGTSLRKEMARLCKEKNSIMPMVAICHLVKDGVESKELRNDLPIEYMIYTIIAKLVMYAAYKMRQSPKKQDLEMMRELTKDSIFREFRIA